MERQTIGAWGEILACEYLVEKGRKILARNYRRPWGEIDIVARTRDGTLIFIEVKTLQERGEEALAPEDNVSAAKLRRLRRTCEAFVAKNPHLLDEKKGWRIDLVAISLRSAKEPEIRHYENI